MEVLRSRTNSGRVPEVGDILLIIDDSKNRGEWKKGRVQRLVKERDGVVRGVVLLHNGKQTERPLQLVASRKRRYSKNYQGKETGGKGSRAKDSGTTVG